MLTTVDNPYNPHDDYDKWMMWDQDHGYFTSEYLARLAQIDEEMDDESQEAVIKQAQKEIVEADASNTYVIV